MSATLTLGALTQHDDDLALERAVQLDWFTTDPVRNEKLTRSFIWTKDAPKGFVSSGQILNQTMEAFLKESNLNELVVRATYGQGKTHLAVALANYFGQPADSTEAQNVLAKYARCTGQSAERFANFKAGRQPFLILRLRGDRRENLAQAVVTGLEAALHQHPATATATLGLWFEEAKRILGTIKGPELAQANDFLAAHSLDLDSLSRSLDARDDTHYDLLHDLLLEVRHVVPNFGRTADPGQAIELVCDTYCGADKPFAGLLVLFDEFSLFVNSYAGTYRTQHGAPLQRFLDGIYNRKGKAVLLAFAQQSPHATTLLKDKILAGGGHIDDTGALIREMTRLDPKDELFLYAPMEDVLDAYLQQDEDAWNELMQDDDLFSQSTDAADQVQRLFPERYTPKLNWDEERIQEVLVKGCFPLHPVATAIMCSVKLPATDNARSVLSFVVEAVQAAADQPAVRPTDQQLNFIPATRLVQGLGEVLAEDPLRWRQFSDALHLIGGEAPDSWREVLQALFLHEVLDLKVRPGEFAQNIAALSGRPTAECAELLDTLHNRRYIRHDESRQAYTFWPSGQNGKEVYEQLEKETNAIISNSDKLREELGSWLNGLDYYRYREISFASHQFDWRAHITLLPVSLWSTEALRKIVQTYGWDEQTNNLRAPFRGYIISPLAADEHELQWVRENAERTLNELAEELGDTIPPVLIIIPANSQTELVRKLVGQRVLHSWKKDKQEQLGQQSYGEARASFDSEVQKLLDAAEKQGLQRVIVPRPYRAAVELSARPDNVSETLMACYRAAYRYVPPFFQQYKDNNRNMVKAVRMGCGYLAEGSFDGWEKAAPAFPVAQELFNRYLSVGGTTNWGFVDGSKRVGEPQLNSVREAYNLLETTVPRASEKVPLRPLLGKLLNPPYGLDYNTLSLVFCGWYGSHHQHLFTYAANGRALRLGDWLLDGADPRKAIETLCRLDVQISRRDETQIQGRINTLVQQVKAKNRYTLEEAQSVVAELEQYAADPVAEQRLKENAAKAVQQLASDIAAAAEFEVGMQKMAEQLLTTPAAGMMGLKLALSYKLHLPSTERLGSVRPAAEADLPALTEQTRNRMRDVAEKLCDDLARLTSIAHYELQKSKLDTIRTELEKAKEYDLMDVVEQSKRKIEKAKNDLLAKDQDIPFLSRFDNIKNIQSLAQLRELATAAADYAPGHEDTRTKLARHQETLQTAIEKAEKDLVSWQAKLSGQLTSKGLNEFKTTLDQNSFRYLDTPENETLSAISAQRDNLKKFFDKLAKLKEEAPRTHSELQKLLTSYDKLAALPGLSAEQQALATSARDTATAKLQQQIDKAVADLQRQAARCQEPEYDAVQLIKELDQDSPFLPKEHVSQLNNLRKTVRTVINKSVASQVEDMVFNQITDPSIRLECLQRLQIRLAQTETDITASVRNGAEVASTTAV
ncbi:hypothetical protein [Hymenobacter ruber]